MKIFSFIMIFLLMGAFFIISENKLALKEPENRDKFVEIYTGWAEKLFDNSKDLAGYVVKLDWLPEEG